MVFVVMVALAGPAHAPAPPPPPPPGPLSHHELEIILARDERIGHRRVAFLARDWLFCDENTGAVIRVPAGYETDFASIPRQLWWLINPFGDQAEGSIVHDWLYAVGERGKFDFANKVFRSGLLDEHVPLWKADLMYAAVSGFGHKPYGKDEEWECRFRSVATEAAVEPPSPRPMSAIVGLSPSHCDPNKWDQEVIDHTDAGDWNYHPALTPSEIPRAHVCDDYGKN